MHRGSSRTEHTSRGRRWRRPLALAGLVGLLAVAMVALAAPGAFAWQRYYATANGLALRSGPGTTFRVVGYVNYGAPLDIDCQVQQATSVGGNRTWDHLTGGQWVTDYYTTTPSFNSYAPGLGPCSREWRSMGWASARVGQTGWNGWCERFVENSYGTTGRYGSALADFYAQRAAGRMHYDTNPPGGALVFYRNPYDGGFGHVEVSRGDGSFISTGPTVQIVGFGYGGTFIGWSYAPPDWPGV